MYTKVYASVATVVVALMLWEVLASILLVLIFGYTEEFPWPGRAIAWWRYWTAMTGNPIVTRWLIITGVIALVVPGLMIAVLIKILNRQNTPAVYGESEFASPRAFPG